MIKLLEEIEIARPLPEVFRYLADFSTIEQWDPGVYRSVKMTPGPVRVGTEYSLILNSGGRRVPMRYRTLEITECSRILLKGEADSFSVTDLIEVQAVSEDRTRVIYRADLTFKGGSALAEKALTPWLRRVGRAAVEGLRRAIETPSEPSSESAMDRFKRTFVLPAAWDFTEKGYLSMPRKGLSDFMDGQVVVITGPTSGIGLAAACEFSRLGATLALVGRSATRLQAARDTVLAFSGRGPDSIQIFEAELTLRSELTRVAHELLQVFPEIDVLVHNAGALFTEREVTSEGHEKTFAIHVMAPWILTEELREPLRKAGGRVILVSSGGMYTQALDVNDLESSGRPFDGVRAYARAKRAQMGLLRHWSQDAAWQGVGISAMHPGWARTPGVEKSLPGFGRLLGARLRDARMGADTLVWLASAPEVAGHSGHFWLDRKVRPTEVFPGTHLSDSDQSLLISVLKGLAPTK